jgi:hypothetical protein
MKRAVLVLAFATAALAQTPPAASISTLPSILVGGGTSWTRGQAYPYSAVIHFAMRVGTSNWYSWSEISTPVASVPAGAAPLPSTLTTGGAWVAAQSAGGRISLVVIGTVGMSAASASTPTGPAFTGSFGIPIRLHKDGNVYLMLYFKAAGATAGGANGAAATFTLQPGISLLYKIQK